LVKNHRRFIAGNVKSLSNIFFALIFLTLTPATIFDFARFSAKVSKVMERGSKQNFGLQKWYKKKWRGAVQQMPLLSSPPPSEFYLQNFGLI
jgi:hypothetical protein